ncbi:hypothetical protein GYMLUDRAFT_469522 [Collybiopsis luxurians FD-317 M1]|uniref:Unplaced genomic scaffold GYMLUscaffold_161, whole genome shotgun sequence n=1 Tax=Collybiopsis luxurians FD-317 M1 TaxID=944289 RepID=A0A0D0AJG4_9AGAR|nr:hypothetical protein GYMLUDRAFT_469522 [Collybiopsis luxurians FD-317 M1]
MHSSQHNADQNQHLPHHISTISTPVSVSLSPTPTSSRVYTFPTPNLLASVLRFQSPSPQLPLPLVSTPFQPRIFLHLYIHCTSSCSELKMTPRGLFVIG